METQRDRSDVPVGTTSPSGTDLEKRLARLEGSVRRSRALAVAALVALTAGAWMPAGPLGLFEAGTVAADDVEATTFRLVDDDGATRATLGFGKKGGPMLQFFDDQEVPRVRIGLHAGNEPALFLADRTGTSRMVLISDLEGNPQLVMTMPGGKPAAQMAVNGDGEPSLVFTHRTGYMNAGIGLDKKGQGWILERGLPAGVDPSGIGGDQPGDTGGGKKDGDGGKNKDGKDSGGH